MMNWCPDNLIIAVGDFSSHTYIIPNLSPETSMLSIYRKF